MSGGSAEDCDSALWPVVNFVIPQDGMRVLFDPHARHRIVENVVVLDQGVGTGVNLSREKRHRPKYY